MEQPSRGLEPEAAAGLELRDVWAGPPGAAAVVVEVSLVLNPGEIGVLLGGNGAGKTTLLRTAAGLWPPLHGRVLGPHRGRFDPSRVGMVLEEPASQFVTGSVREELEFVLENLERPRPELEARVHEVLLSLGLLDLASRDPRTLSAGEQQRALVAAALAPSPDLLFLDDPFLHLGDGETVPVWSTLLEAVRRGDTGCLLLATHDADLAVDADRVGVLSGNHLVSWGSPETVLGGPLPGEITPPFALRLLSRLEQRGWRVPGHRLDLEGLAERLVTAAER